MLRTMSRAAIAALAMSVGLIATACMSNTPTPSPSALAPTAAPASITPTPVASAAPEPTPAASPSQVRIGRGAWAVTGSMIHGRSYGATATVLQDGRVLVTGGEDGAVSATAASELYDPRTGVWTATRKMNAPRRGHVATLLRDGRVLVTGGWSYISAVPPAFGELYDPKTGTWTKTSPMTRSRYSPEATTLADGRVLVAGGSTDCGCSTRRAEIYDPSADTWTATRNMPSPSDLATLLADGRAFLISEGRPAETFDPASGRWHKIADTPTGMRWSEAVSLKSGDVLLIAAEVAKGELYDPVADTWTAIDVPHTGRGPAAILEDGTVLVVGRVSSARFDPATGAWSAVPRPPFIRDYALDSIDGVELNLMAELRDGRVLATSFGSTAIYDPTAGS